MRTMRLAGVLALLLPLVGACATHAQQTTTVVLVRHAEKQAEPADDPPLSADGAVRAQALVDALGAADIAAVYATQYVRTRATAAPLARAAGVEVTTVPTRGGPDYVTEVARRAGSEHPGEVVVVVGHSNTLGRTITALGGPATVPDLPDSAYDHAYVLLLTEGRAPRLLQLRFGAPTPGS